MQLRTLLFLVTLSASNVAAHADGVGTPVTGGLFFGGGTTNYFNPALGFVPAGSGNTAGTQVTIGSGIEFGFDDGANLDTANFTGNALVVRDVDTYGGSAFEMTFVDPVFTGFTMLPNTSGFTYSFAGDTLKVFFPEEFNPGTYTAKFSYGPPAAAVTPEPASLVLLGTGILGMWGAARRRYTA
jgi:hypothetical protein